MRTPITAATAGARAASQLAAAASVCDGPDPSPRGAAGRVTADPHAGAGWLRVWRPRLGWATR